MIKRKYLTGGQIGTAIGASTAAIPGVGLAISPIAGMLGGAIGGLFDKNKTKKTYSMGTASYKKGGKLKKYVTGGQVPIGQGASKYVGNSHEQGGIPVTETGQPTSRDNAVAEVEGGETIQDDYIFSDELLVPGTEMTFAEAHEMLVQEGATPEEIQQLQQMQEEVRMQGGEQPMQQEMPMEMTEQPMMEKGGKLKKMPDGGFVGPFDLPDSLVKANQVANQVTKKRVTSPLPNTLARPRNASSFIHRGSLQGQNITGRNTPQSYPQISPLPIYLAKPKTNKKFEMPEGLTKANEVAGTSRTTTPQAVTSQTQPRTTVPSRQIPFYERQQLNNLSGNRLATIGNSITTTTPETNIPSVNDVGERITTKDVINANPTDWNTIGRFGASAMKAGIAAFAPRPKKIPKVATNLEKENTTPFSNARRQIRSGMASAPKNQGMYANFIEGTNRLATGESEYRTGVANRNADRMSQTQRENTRITEANNQAQAQDTASRIGLGIRAITDPIQAKAMDDAIKSGNRQAIIAAAANIPDRTERENFLREFLPKARYGGKLKRRKY